MGKIKYFTEKIGVRNKYVILRLDLNVPIINKKIQDYTRIDLSLPLIKSLRNKRAKIIILSHLGRPKGKADQKLSLKPIFDYLKKRLKSKIFFHTEEITRKTKQKITFLKGGEIMLFENVRFNKGETNDSNYFAKNLASLGDIYVNDAFSCSHRKQASIHKITHFLTFKYGGPLLRKEVEAIDKIINSRRSPVTCIIGGSKISTKINVLRNLISKVDNIFIVGAMANNFLKFNGIRVGKSLIEKNTKIIIEKIYTISKKNNCTIFIPIDYKTSNNLGGNATSKGLESIKNNEMILDIGKQTIKKIDNIIEKSKTVLWNGPAGYFENDNFLEGTLSIAKKISGSTIKNNLISIVGGGDTLFAINKSRKKFRFTHLSTAGGAFLEFLEGKDLPGLNVLK